jgi:DNA mismatch repair ATPase MutL
MLALATSLFDTRAPLTSPSGRPTFFEIGEAEMARRFQK